MIRLTAFIVFVGLLATAFPNSVEGQSKMLLDEVIAQVGGEYILLSEIEQQYAFNKENYPKETDPVITRCRVLENLLAQNLLVNQAKLDSVLVADEEIEMQLDARIENILGSMGNDVERFENYYGMTVEQVKEEQRKPLRNQVMAERMQNNVMRNVQATPTEVVEFYHSIPRDSLPFYNSEVQISELVLIPEASQEEKEKSLNKLTSIRSQIITGEKSFEELATTFSDDASSARQGGSLGWQRRGTFVPEFEAAAYNLEPGEISQPIETEFGYHIIELLERRGNNILARHVLLKPKITEEVLSETQNELDSIKTQIIADSIPFARAVRMFGNEKVQSYSNGGRIVNNATGNTFFEVGDLDPDIYFAIIELEVGEISEVTEFADRGGEKRYKIFKLLTRTKPHRANLQEDFAKIRNLATEYKRANKFNQWLLNKLSETYIEIDERYHICPNVDFWLGKEDETAKIEQ